MKRILFILSILFLNVCAFSQMYNNNQRVFNVKLFGATGNGVYDTTGAITSGGGALSTVTSLFTSADVGKTIVVMGAGTSGRDLVTTIATFTDATHVGLTANAGTTVSSNAKIIYGTDQTTFIQAAINAAYSIGKGSIVYIPNGIYIIAGALQTSVGGLNMNAQLYIPADSATSLSKTDITIRGETTPNYTQFGVLTSSNVNSYKGAVLLSTLTSGATGAAVIGTTGYTSAFGSFNLTYLTVENLIIKVLDNPAGAGVVVGGISYKNGASLIANQVYIGNIGSGQSSVQPTNDITGIETPDYLGETMTSLKLTLVSGFKYGYKLGEHANLDQAQAFVCYYGFGIKSSGHNIHAGRLLSQWCVNDIYSIVGSVVPSVIIDAMAIEYISSGVSGGKWYDNVYTINDSTNQIKGMMFFTINAAVSGAGNTHFVKNGGTHFDAYAIGDSTAFPFLKGNNTWYVPGTSLINNFYFDSTTTNIFRWGRPSRDYWEFGSNVNGDKKFDFWLTNKRTSKAAIYSDTTGILNLGGNAGVAANAGETISADGLSLVMPGKLNIGSTSAPVETLDVNSSAITIAKFHQTGTNHSGLNFDGASGKNSNIIFSTAGVNKWYLQNEGATDNINILNSDANGNSNRFKLTQAGILTLGAYGAGTATFDASGNISSVSDTRLKKDIKPYTIGLKQVLNINPITFRYNNVQPHDTVNTYAGFSAQNIRDNIPYATGKDESGYLTLQDRAIMAALVNAIKEQQKEIENLQKEIKQLKK